MLVLPAMGVLPPLGMTGVPAMLVLPAKPVTPPLPLPAVPGVVPSPPEEQAVPSANSAPKVPKVNKVVLFRFIFSPMMCSKALEPVPGKCLVRSRAPKRGNGLETQFHACDGSRLSLADFGSDRHSEINVSH